MGPVSLGDDGSSTRGRRRGQGRELESGQQVVDVRAELRRIFPGSRLAILRQHLREISKGVCSWIARRAHEKGTRGSSSRTLHHRSIDGRDLQGVLFFEQVCVYIAKIESSSEPRRDRAYTPYTTYTSQSRRVKLASSLRSGRATHLLVSQRHSPVPL